MTPKIKIEGRFLGVKADERNADREYAAIEVPSYGDKMDTFKVQAWKDKQAFAKLKAGDTVSIEAFVHSRKWKNESTGKISYFVDFDAVVPRVEPQNESQIEESSADDLPF